MNDTPLASPDAAGPALAATPAAPAPTPRELTIRFTGSGSEYFRIWIVNLLLTLVTLGLYLPFAKARRIRYFYANTLIDGQALSFHGDPWKMFRGFILLAVLMACYSGAGHLSPYAALPAFILLCVVWPALWRASMQFRLGNTSWRGLRMRFHGSLKGAYLAVAPLYLPLILMVTTSVLMGVEAASGDPQSREALKAQLFWSFGALGLVALATPWFLAATKRYQHDNFGLAGQRTRMVLSTGRFYFLSLKGVLISIPAGVLSVALFMVGTFLIGSLAGATGPTLRPEFYATLGAVFGVLAYLVYFALVGPYFAARMQNMVWSATRSQAVGFESRLAFTALFWLTLKNWSLVLLTLGLYRPFAAVSTARLRLEAMRIGVDGHIDTWAAAAGDAYRDATGDAAGDFFGIDMGL